jgi:hypothetical protein
MQSSYLYEKVWGKLIAKGKEYNKGEGELEEHNSVISNIFHFPKTYFLKNKTDR